MSLIHRKQKNGSVYVYESKSYWDSEKKQPRSKRTLLGKLDPETGEIIPTKKRKKEPIDVNHQDQLVVRERKSYGATALLRDIAKQSGVREDLTAVFHENVDQILALADFLLLSPTNAMRNFERWARSHETFLKKPLSSQRISELFQSITVEQKQQFFMKQIRRHRKEEVWVYDTTSISSYSQNLTQVKYGYNKESDPIPQLNLGLVYGEESGLPVLYRVIRGNVPDSKTLAYLISLLDDFETSQKGLVLDRGFYTKENVQMLCEEHLKFIVGGKKSAKYIKEAIESIRNDIKSIKNYSVKHELYMKQVDVGGTFKASKTSHYPVKVHIYLNMQQYVEDEKTLFKTLDELQKELNSGNRQESHENEYRRYFVQDKTTKRYKMNESAVEEKLKNMGMFVLVTNQKYTSERALELYREKDVVEKAFENIKDRLNMRRVRVSSDESLEGKLFIQFVSLLLGAHVRRRMKQAKLDEYYTMDDLLGEVELIDRYVHPEHGYTLGEILEAQKQIFAGMKVHLT